MRTVNELSQEELEELREAYYYQGLDDGSLVEIVGKEIESVEDIPLDLVKSHYGGTYFVEEDFFCNIKD